MQPPRSALRRSFVGRDLGDLLLGEPAGGVDDEAAAFERVMADRHLDLVGEDRPDQRARKLRDMDFLVLRHQRVAGERIVVLPAGQRADAADGGVDHREAGAVALPPDHPLVEGRRDLAALEHQRAVGVEDELRVVERAVVALVDAEHDDHAVLARRGAHRLRHRAGHDDRVVVEADVLGAAQHRRTDEGEIGIPGHEGLGKHDEPRALARGLRDRREDAVERPRRRIEIGRDLHRRDPDDLLLGHCRSSGPPLAVDARSWSVRQSVQVWSMKALSLRCRSMRSSTSSGLIGRMPGISDGSPWPYSACSAKRQA